MSEPRVSALIIAKDEADTLPGCLDSLGWVDEIVVVVDAASRDGTERIARARADIVIVREFDGFASQRNAAREQARGAWVIAVDADERVTPELTAEIQARLSAPCSFAGFRIPIRSVVFGRAFRGSGTQFDRPLRLFRRACGRWSGAVHETVELDGAVTLLRAHLMHTTHGTLREFIEKLNHYTDLEAGDLWSRGIKPRWIDWTLRPMATFLKLYFARGGYRDGVEGFAFCSLSAVSLAVRAWKLRELARGSGTRSSGPVGRAPGGREAALAGARGCP